MIARGPVRGHFNNVGKVLEENQVGRPVGSRIHKLNWLAATHEGKEGGEVSPKIFIYLAIT